jgi:protein gp37
MSDKSAIEWTDATWTPIRARNLTTGKIGWHCEKVSAGCVHCYAESINLRLGTQRPYAGIVRVEPNKTTHKPAANVEVYLDEPTLTKPLSWRKPRQVFVCSMTDLFGEWVPDEWIDRMFAVMAHCPQHTFQVLTKRPERMVAYCGDPIRRGYLIGNAAEDLGTFPKTASYFGPTETWRYPLENVWLGVSVENQATADERIPLLLNTPAAVRFVSYEPALGPADFATHFGIAPNHDDLRGLLHWLIVGGESGPNARPCDVAWIRSAVEQCKAAGVPVFCKQLGSRPFHGHYCEGSRFRLRDGKGGDPDEWPEDLRVRDYPGTVR